MGPLTLLVRRATNSARDLGMTAGGYAAVGLLVLIGAGFLVAAGFMLLANAIGPILAATVFGLVPILVAAIWAAVMAARARERKRRRQEAAASTAMIASGLTLANTGLRFASRTGGGRLWLPAAAVVLAVWFFSREGDD